MKTKHIAWAIGSLQFIAMAIDSLDGEMSIMSALSFATVLCAAAIVRKDTA